MQEGKKLDAGKPLAGLLEQDFPRALKLVAEVATFGAKKYSRSNWLLVPDAKTRYLDAKVRHQLEGNIQPTDEESGLLHRAHEAWNCLVLLELELKELEARSQATRLEAKLLEAKLLVKKPSY